MGGGRWTEESYTKRASLKAEAGYKSAFSHTEDVRSGKVKFGVHEDLDPKKVNKQGDHTDMNIREALDSTEHPNSTPIMVLFDVTGSMGRVPAVLQVKLPKLHALLEGKDIVADPQLLFGAIGDGYSDRVPLQVGQFESDDRGDEQLENIFLEHGGGGGNHESYELAAYFALHHTFIDSLDKRGKKGYLFIIGDERLYSQVNASQIREVIGGNSDSVQDHVDTKDLFKDLQEKFNVYFLYAQQGGYNVEQVLDGIYKNSYYGSNPAMGWRELLGQNAIILDDADCVCETIALTLALNEGTLTLEDGMDILSATGCEKNAVEAAGKALSGTV